MTVKILLLKSGEDVIADVKEMVSPDKKVIGYFLSKPCIIKLYLKNRKVIKEKPQYQCILGCHLQRKKKYHYQLIG